MWVSNASCHPLRLISCLLSLLVNRMIHSVEEVHGIGMRSSRLTNVRRRCALLSAFDEQCESLRFHVDLPIAIIRTPSPSTSIRQSRLRSLIDAIRAQHLGNLIRVTGRLASSRRGRRHDFRQVRRPVACSASCGLCSGLAGPSPAVDCTVLPSLSKSLSETHK